MRDLIRQIRLETDMKKITQFGAFSVCRLSSGKFVVRQDRKTIATHDHLFDAERDASTRNNAEWDAMAKMLKSINCENDCTSA